MSKKFVVLALCVVLVVGLFVFFTCGDDDTTPEDFDVEEGDSRSAVSLNFYIITDDRTTDEAIKQMQEAFNEVSEEKYRTHVEFILCTEAEYHKLLEEKFTAIENGEVQAPGSVDTDKGTIGDMDYDENGRPTVKYPEIAEGQVDILLVTDKKQFDEYTEKGRLFLLNDLLTGEFKNVRSYINAHLYNSVGDTGFWYGVPNNRVLGDYTYLLVNRKVAESNYLYEEHFFTTYGEQNNRIAINYDNVQRLVDAVAAKNATAANADKMVPLYSGETSGVAFEFPAVNFWTEDNTPSLFTTFYDAGSKAGDVIEIVNPLMPNEKSFFIPAADSYVSYLRLIAASRENNYTTIPAGMALDADTSIGEMNGSEFAVAVVKGDYGLRNQFKDNCYVMTLDAPRIERDAMFDSMLAISSYTCDATRSMEIIADLTTNSQLRNILQYGVEGTHFVTYEEEVKNGKVTMAKILEGCDYYMNIDHTGNAFMAYPCEDLGHTASVWVDGMEQNREALRVPTYGLTPEMMWSVVEEAMIERQMAVQLHKLLGIGAEVTDLMSFSEYYVPLLKESISKSVYADYYDKDGVFTGGPSDDELKATLNALVDAQAERILAQLEEEAANVSKGTIAEAKLLSVQYIERLLSCRSVKEFDETLEAVRLEMGQLSVFSNTSTDNGTPLGMYTQSEKLVDANYTLAGALYNWWRGTYQ